MSTMLQATLDWVLKNKVVTFLGVCLFSFIVALIAVSVKKDNYLSDLTTCQNMLDNLTQTTTEKDTTSSTQIITTSPPDIPSKTVKQVYRLPSHTIPTQYKIKLHPHLQNDDNIFEGFIDIQLEVIEPTEEIVLHANNLTVKQIDLFKDESTNISISFNIAEDDTEFLHIKSSQLLQTGHYDLKIDYVGSLDGIVGFYSSKVTQSRRIATSKFEPTYARQAFPCFDEPAMKANYTVELITPKDYIGLSNMNENKHESFDAENDIYYFDESVKMSSYLACFIVCDFVHKELTVNTDGIGKDFPFRVYATKDQLSKVDFALKFGKDVTEYYIKYFNINYPLPKLDMIAIPDFVSGAMEHWGLVTYKETNLLFDEKTTSPIAMQNIARVVAHEISHMWFGNLVTMKWWNELWLNEGFASYMQYKAVNALNPEWKTLDQFLTSNSHGIMSLDGTLNSHPIVQKVETPDEITAIFDSITYNKGAAVIRMLEGFVGEEDFRKGVTNYLNKHAFSNTGTQDLLNELELIFGPKNPEHNITYIMDTWTRQMGLPVVYVKFKSPSTYILTQKRFLANPENKPANVSQYNDKWYIPITYKTKGNKDSHFVWFPDSKENIEINIDENNKLLKINNDQVGYFRVNYDDSLWEDIKNELDNNSELSISDRANLLNDVFILAGANEVNYELAFQLSTYLKKEKDYVPWSVASSTFSWMKTLMSNSVAYIEFREFVRCLLTDVYKDIESVDQNSEHITRLLQAVIYSLACSMGHEPCLIETENKFRQFLNNGEAIDSNLKGVIYYYGIQRTGEKEWLKLWDKYIQVDDAQEKSKFMQALSASNDPSILKRYLNLAWDEQYVRSQDHLSIIQNVASNPIGTGLAWDHVREKWNDLIDKFTLNSRTLGTTIPAITSSFATPLKLKEMEIFFETNPEAGAGATARKQALEKVQNNIKWLEKYEPTVRSWLEKQGPNAC